MIVVAGLCSDEDAWPAWSVGFTFSLFFCGYQGNTDLNDRLDSCDCKKKLNSIRARREREWNFRGNRSLIPVHPWSEVVGLQGWSCDTPAIKFGLDFSSRHELSRMSKIMEIVQSQRKQTTI